MLPERRQKNLVLIVGREFASLLATPVLISDAAGALVYFNEPAEAVLGTTFAETGELPAERWSSLFQIRDPDGNPLTLDRIPAGIALLERRPAQGTVSIVGLDGVARTLATAAIPLFAHADEFVGMAVVFWEESPREEQ